MASTWKENKLQRAEVDRMASLKIDQKPKCQRRQDRQSGLRRKPSSRPRCLEWGNKSRLSARHKELMVSKNTDRRERPLTKGATPQGKTESMATHVEAFVELATDSGSIPDTSTKTTLPHRELKGMTMGYHLNLTGTAARGAGVLKTRSVSRSLKSVAGRGRPPIDKAGAFPLGIVSLASLSLPIKDFNYGY